MFMLLFALFHANTLAYHAMTFTADQVHTFATGITMRYLGPGGGL